MQVTVVASLTDAISDSTAVYTSNDLMFSPCSDDRHASTDAENREVSISLVQQ
jgi:hypothetical protein